MSSARCLVAILILLGAALAACSGNFGSGATPPNGLLPSGNLAGINPSPTPTPNSASNIVTYGSSSAFQPLPTAGGYGGAIAFAVPSPKPSGFSDVPIGATISIVRPTDAPDLNLASKGKKPKKRERPARALAYITLLPTRDITLDSYPRIAVDVPRDIVTVYRENELGIALYNAGAKDSTFRLAAAELDVAAAPPTPTPAPSAPLPPTAIPVSASAVPSSVVSASPSPVAPSASPTLPPQRIVFAGTAATLKMSANRPVVFALYALPVATPAPSPHPSATVAASPEARRSATPAAVTSPSPSPSPAPSRT